ncbi:glycogen/starch/alpha-glucan phosphorylase, partial [Rhizobium ruizarguesonis]
AADFDAYAQAQREVDQILTNQSAWYTKTINNTARMGWFSSDRTIRQYADEIWRAVISSAEISQESFTSGIVFGVFI